MNRRLPYVFVLGIFLIGLVAVIASTARAADPPRLVRLSDHLAVYQGPVNVGILHDGARAWLIDSTGEDLAESLSSLGVERVQRVLFTHYHRDQMVGVRRWIEQGAKILVPAAERENFESVETFWNGPNIQMHRARNLRPHYLMSGESIAVDQGLDDQQELRFATASIRVLSTPGHTNGSASYQVDVDGRRVVFSGDAIHSPGRLWSIFALQKAVRTGGYHGFMGAWRELVESLRKLKTADADQLVPSHGTIMEKPAAAIDLLIARLEKCYDDYVAISALRHYKPEVFVEYADRQDHMTFAETKEVPDCLAHVGTSWILKSKEGPAFVMDCGRETVVDEIEAMIERGEITAVEGLWITHYHHDHVDGVAKFQATFDCPLVTDRHVAQVIAEPTRWRLPCVSPIVARVDRATEGRDTWPWHEFQLTAMHLPGQTLYHSGLLVEGQGVRMLFTGDSFTMAGIDDYCAANRNWLGRDVGFQHCLSLIEELEPTHLFNCHVAVPWTFSPEQIAFMRDNLDRRERIFGEIVPWPHANFGMDDTWVHCDPYQQNATPGETVEIEVVLTNHADDSATVEVGAGSAHGKRTVGAKATARIPLAIAIPAEAHPGRRIVPVDVVFDGLQLPQFTEAMVDVARPGE